MTTGLPALTLSTGVRIRVQTGVTTQIIKAGFVEDVTAGQTGATRDVLMNSGAWGWFYLDLGQEYPKGTNLCFQEWPRWASLPAYYPETDTAALAFQEVNQFGAALADLTLGDTQWSSVTKATSYGVMVPRVIIGVGLSAKPKSFSSSATASRRRARAMRRAARRPPAQASTATRRWRWATTMAGRIRVAPACPSPACGRPRTASLPASRT